MIWMVLYIIISFIVAGVIYYLGGGLDNEDIIFATFIGTLWLPILIMAIPIAIIIFIMNRTGFIVTFIAGFIGHFIDNWSKNRNER